MEEEVTNVGNEQTNAPELIRPEITPSMQEIETSKDPFALLNKPMPILTPFIPDGVPPLININHQLQGDISSGPTPNPIVRGEGSANFIKALTDRAKNTNWAKDKNKYTRTGDYGAGYKDMNFERYYSHPKFEQLGFNPYRDNETFYNERSSWWDDNSRMMGQWLGLAWNGFASLWQDERTSAEAMEKGMAIGNSTRGGFGGWITNFGLNSAYTVGILGEMALENAALFALDVATFGGAAEAHVARNIMNVGRLGKAISGVSKTIQALRKVEKARDLWNVAKTGGTAVGKFFNPLGRTTEFVTHLAKGTNSVKNLGELAKVSQGFGHFYRDIQEIRVAHAEALLEGQMAANQYHQQLMDEFYAANGRLPGEEEANSIRNAVGSVKTNVTRANDVLIYATNRILFDSLADKFRIGSKLKDAFMKGGTRQLAKTAAKDFKAGVTRAFTADATLPWYKRVSKGLFQSGYSPLSKKYFFANLSEGIQEVGQEAITEGMIYYQDQVRSNNMQLGFWNAMGGIAHGLGDQVSARGVDTFLQGYLMGSLIQGAGGVASYGYAKAGQLVTGENPYKKMKAQADKTNNSILNAANALLENPLIYSTRNADAASEINISDKERKKAKAEGDVKVEQDQKFQMKQKYFVSLARSNSLGLIQEYTNDLLNLSDEELAEAYNLPKDQASALRESLSSLSAEAKGFQRKYDRAKKELVNPYNPWLFKRSVYASKAKREEAERLFKEEYRKWEIHELAIEDVVFSTEAYGNVAERMSSMFDNLTGRTELFYGLLNVVREGTIDGTVPSDEIAVLLDDSLRARKKKALKDQIEVFETGTPEQQAEAKELREYLDVLEEFETFAQTYKETHDAQSKAPFTKRERERRLKRARIRKGAKVRITRGKNKGQVYEVENVTDSGLVRLKGQTRKEGYSKGSFEIVEDAPGKPAEFETLGDPLTEQSSLLYDAFDRYIRHVAKMKKGYVFNDKVNAAFKQLHDYFILEQEARGLAETINLLANPQYFEQYKDILLRVEKEKEKRRLENLQKALEEFKKQAQENDLLNELFKIGVFVLPEDIESLKNFTLTNFYDIATKNLVDPASEKYQEILEVMEKFAGQAEQTVTGRPIPEAKGDPKFNNSSRPKLANDKRPYSAHAEQYGFDPNAEKTDVPLIDVLRKIAESKHATAAERYLARRLMSLAPSDSVVSFVNNLDTPGKASTDGEILVDARYSSQEYLIGATGHPLEFVMLHEILHHLTLESLRTDVEFNNKITELRALAIEYFKTREYKEKYGDRPLYGLKNNAEFVAEAMTNVTFQSMLREIAHEVSGKPTTAWEEFVNALQTLLRRLFKVKDSTTVLDEALYIITTRLDTPTLKAEEKAKTKKPATGEEVVGAITQGTKVSKMPDDLVDELLGAYRNWAKAEEEDGGSPIPSSTAAEADIVGSEAFQSFVDSNSSATDIIDTYNQKMGIEEEAVPTDIESKKADIERRREEELDKVDLFHGTATAENVLSGVYDINAGFVTAGQAAGAGLYLTNDKKVGERYAKQALEQRKAKNLEGGESKVLVFNSKDFNIVKEGRIGEELFKKIQEKYPENTSITADTKATDLFRKLVELEYGVPFSASLETSEMIPVMLELGIDGIEIGPQTVLYNFEKIKNNEINAKYDAELAALEEVPEVITDELQIGDEIVFSGPAITRAGNIENFQNARMRVIDRAGEQVDEEGTVSDVVKVRNLDTGVEYSIDLAGEDVGEYKIEPLIEIGVVEEEEEEAPKAERTLVGEYKNTGIEIWNNPELKTKTGELGAAKRTKNAQGEDIIEINETLLVKKFIEKAWTKPYKQLDGSFAEALKPDAFDTFDEFVNFVLEHEYQHTLLTRKEFDNLPENKGRETTTGEYENEINRRAAEALGIEIYPDENIAPEYSNREQFEAELADVTNAEELEAIKNKVDITFAANLGDAFFNSEYAYRRMEEKKEALAKSLSFDELQKDLSVQMHDGTIMIVENNNGKEVVLRDPDGVKPNVTLTRENFDKKEAGGILIKNSDFVDMLEDVETPTENQVKESDEAVEAAAEEDTDADKKEMLEKANESEIEDLEEEFDNAFRNCKL